MTITLSEFLHIAAEAWDQVFEESTAPPRSHWQEVTNEVLLTTLHHGANDGDECKDPVIHHLISDFVDCVAVEGDIPANEQLADDELAAVLLNLETRIVQMQQFARRLRGALPPGARDLADDLLRQQ